MASNNSRGCAKRIDQIPKCALELLPKARRYPAHLCFECVIPGDKDTMINQKPKDSMQTYIYLSERTILGMRYTAPVLWSLRTTQNENLRDLCLDLHSSFINDAYTVEMLVGRLATVVDLNRYTKQIHAGLDELNIVYSYI